MKLVAYEFNSYKRVPQLIDTVLKGGVFGYFRVLI